MSVEGQLSSGEGANSRPSLQEVLTQQVLILSHTCHRMPFSSSQFSLRHSPLPITAGADDFLSKSWLNSYQMPRKEIPAVAPSTMHTSIHKPRDAWTDLSPSDSLSWQQQPCPKVTVITCQMNCAKADLPSGHGGQEG